MGTSLAVQWLRLRAPTTRDVGLIPGWGTRIPHASRRGQRKKQENKKTEKMISRGEELEVLALHSPVSFLVETQDQDRDDELQSSHCAVKENGINSLELMFS